MAWRRGFGSLLVFALAACSSKEPATPDAMALRVESTAVPASLRGLFAPDFDLEGCWNWSWLPGFDSTALCVRRTNGETFALEFLHSTDYAPPSESSVQARW